MRRAPAALVLGGTALAAVVAAAVVGPLGFGDARPGAPSTSAVTVSLGAGGRPADVATGFTAGPGRVVTVAHLFDGGGRARVRVRERAGRWHAARLLARDRRSDLALLAAPGLAARGLRIGTAGERVRLLRPGDREAAIVSVRRAIDARVRAPGTARAHRRPALELAASVSAGDSGAPVVTPGGAVAGLIFARSRSSDDTAYAVDAAALRRLLRSAETTASR